MNTIKIISVFAGVLVIIVLYIVATKTSKEHFPNDVGDMGDMGDMGIPTKDIDESLYKVPNTVFYKELPGDTLMKLFPKVPLEMPQANVADFLADYMNKQLPNLSRCINTSNTPFLVKSVRKVLDNTLRIVLHREGKMYAIVIDVSYTASRPTSINLVGYLSEYDVTSWPGYDLSTSHTLFPNDVAQTIIKDANYENKLVQKQQYDIKADRGISG
jgi:hypothetical protein